MKPQQAIFDAQSDLLALLRSDQMFPASATDIQRGVDRLRSAKRGRLRPPPARPDQLDLDELLGGPSA